jgi:phosphatidate cytidylyltransferase
MTRVLSALVLLTVVIGTIWFLPPVATLILAAVAAPLAFVEYARLAEALGARVPRILTGAAIVAACLAVGSTVLPLEVVLMSAFIAIAALAVAAGNPSPAVLRDVSASVLPLLYIGLPLGSLAAIRLVGGREALMLLVVTIVVSDSGQYYTGRALGRRPLAPSISPKKTVEGAIGGVVLGTAAMTFGGLKLFPAASVSIVVVAAAAVVALGIVGDLFESLLKRSAGVKDSSHLIPGHGGILDRIDSWLFAGPVYYVFVRYLQV